MAARKNAERTKQKYTDKQKRKAAHIEEGYERRGVPKKQAEARAWATVNKSDGGGKKPGGSGRGQHKPEPATLRKGSPVQWKNGASTAFGKVLAVFRDKVVKTIQGKRITRNATPDKPAALVESDQGGQALHSASELKRVPRGRTRK